MIIELNYLTIAIIAGVLSAVGGLLWAVGRSLLQQYGDMLRDQLTAHRNDTASNHQGVVHRLITIERDMEEHTARIARLDALAEKAPTHDDLGKLYDKVNSTAENVAAIAGEMKGINGNLRMILNRIAERGL
ncbi:MAG: hypothetical protein ACK4KV_09535 [Rhodocyclaceae bacterium]